MLKKFTDGFAAGFLITIGCSVFLACLGEGQKIAETVLLGKLAGSVFFAVALLTICYMGLSLFTGKVGFIPFSHKKEDFSVLLLGLLGNAVATCGLGMLLGLAIPNLSETAKGLYDSKLMQPLWSTLIRAIFCGSLMYIAVAIYRENKSISGIIFAVPVFILSGFEHSIANMCYFGFSLNFSFDAFIYIWVVIAGNSIGGMILPLLKIAGEKFSKKPRKAENKLDVQGKDDEKAS